MQVTSGIQCNLLSPSYSTIYAPQGDAKSRFVLIQLLEGAAPWEVPAGASVIIRAAKPDGTFCFYDTNEAGESAYSISGSTVTIELVGQVLAAPGPVLMQIDFYNSDGAHLSTFSFCCQVSESVVSDDDIVSSNYFSVLTATLAEMLQIEQAVKAAYGAPLVAATAAAMTDHTRVYVYTGSESGYTNGNWYYWDGSAWASGGVYNSTAINVDSAPTQGSTNPVSSGGVYAADAALSGEVDVLSDVVNYGYNEFVDIPAEPDSTIGTRRVGIRRAFSQITLNCTNATTSLVRIKISGDVAKASNTSGAAAWNTGISLTPGHVYRIDTRLIGGSVNAPSGVNPPYIIAYKIGTSTSLGNNVRDGLDSVYTFVAPNDPVNLVAIFQANVTASNAVYQVILRDKSEIIGDDAGIPQTFPGVQPSASGEIIIPEIVHSEELVNYNCNIDGTKRAVTQAICSDGIRYLFFPARANAGYDADDEAPVMVKWDTVTNAPVVVNANAPKSYGHIEDVCFVPASVPGIDNGNVDRLYLTDMNRSTAAGYTGAVHVLDANSLEFITTVQTYDQNDDSKNLISTALAPNWHGVYHVGYSPDRELFFVQSGGLSSVDPDNRLHQTLAVLDKNGQVIRGLKFVRTAGTIFGSDCDANYIYLGIYSTGTGESAYDINLAVFDWNLNPITSVTVDQKTWEVEGTCHIGGAFYFSWILPAGTARTGCYVTKQTFMKAAHFPANTAFPVNWVENQFPVASFEPFTA